jgi:pimeloyl-ACP methyl ester carboxylesterase
MSGETMVPANGVDLCVQTFGEPSDPPVLLLAGGASSMDWWEDGFCRRLAAGGRYVIRYDHRDTGRSTSFPAGAPPYTGADLAHDALGLLDALGERQAHLVGVSMGGGLAQRIAIEEPARVLTLTLMATAPGVSEPADTAPGGEEEHGADEPDTDEPDTGDGPETDWSDRKTAVDRLVADARQYGGPLTAAEPQLRRLAERVVDRTTDMAASQTNHWILDDGPPPPHGLGAITAPTLVLHGSVDPFFPVPVGEALARAIPGARLVVLDGVGHEHPPEPVWPTVVKEILNHTA